MQVLIDLQMNNSEKQPKFEDLPQAVALLHQRFNVIENLLLKQANESKPSSDNLLTIHQASELVNLSVNTLYALVSKQEIPNYKKRRRLYFNKAELINWIQSGKRKAIL